MNHSFIQQMKSGDLFYYDHAVGEYLCGHFVSNLWGVGASFQFCDHVPIPCPLSEAETLLWICQYACYMLRQTFKLVEGIWAL